MYNKCVFMGRIVNDLELKTTPNGVAVLSFRIAVDRRFQTKGEDKKSDFFNVVAWRNEAEFISKYWGKGRMILIEGELQNRSYTDKNGVERIMTELIVDRACFTGEKKDDTPSQFTQQAKAVSQSATSGNASDFVSDEGNDDYPF